MLLEIPGARSLKDKRQVARSFKERVKSRLSVSIAEVGHLDKLQLASFGVAVVSNDATVCDEILSRVASLAGSLPDALVVDRAVEIIPFGEAGIGVRGSVEQMATRLAAGGPEDTFDESSGETTIDDDDEADKTLDDGDSGPSKK